MCTYVCVCECIHLYGRTYSTYVHVCSNATTYVRTYVLTYICTYSRTYIHLYIYAYIHVYALYLSMYVYTYLHTKLYIRIFCVCVHTYVHNFLQCQFRFSEFIHCGSNQSGCGREHYQAEQQARVKSIQFSHSASNDQV